VLVRILRKDASVKYIIAGVEINNIKEFGKTIGALPDSKENE